jgi:hypothetical protein
MNTAPKVSVHIEPHRLRLSHPRDKEGWIARMKVRVRIDIIDEEGKNQFWNQEFEMDAGPAEPNGRYAHIEAEEVDWNYEISQALAERDRKANQKVWVELDRVIERIREE